MNVLGVVFSFVYFLFGCLLAIGLFLFVLVCSCLFLFVLVCSCLFVSVGVCFCFCVYFFLCFVVGVFLVLPFCCLVCFVFLVCSCFFLFALKTLFPLKFSRFSGLKLLTQLFGRFCFFILFFLQGD